MTDDDILGRAMAGECRADGSTFRVLVAEVKFLRGELRRSDATAAAGRSLARWAAAVNWSEFGTNTREWLDGLQQRIDAVQDKEAGGG